MQCSTIKTVIIIDFVVGAKNFSCLPQGFMICCMQNISSDGKDYRAGIVERNKVWISTQDRTGNVKRCMSNTAERRFLLFLLQ